MYIVGFNTAVITDPRHRASLDRADRERERERERERQRGNLRSKGEGCFDNRVDHARLSDRHVLRAARDGHV